MSLKPMILAALSVEKYLGTYHGGYRFISKHYIIYSPINTNTFPFVSFYPVCGHLPLNQGLSLC